MSGCCNEYGCTRKKPIRLMQGGLTGTWVLIPDYGERDGGGIVARKKHRLHPADERLLVAMQAAADWAMANGYPEAMEADRAR